MSVSRILWHFMPDMFCLRLCATYRNVTSEVSVRQPTGHQVLMSKQQASISAPRNPTNLLMNDTTSCDMQNHFQSALQVTVAHTWTQCLRLSQLRIWLSNMKKKIKLQSCKKNKSVTLGSQHLYWVVFFMLHFLAYESTTVIGYSKRQS